MIPNFDELQKNLLAHAIKPTYIRLIILRCLNKYDFHPTAEDIYNEILKEIPTISRTSVYNTLNLFCEKGLVMPLFLGLETRFEFKKDHHHHFLCKKCGKIIDLDLQCTYFNAGQIDGNEVRELHSCFQGICKQCLQQGKDYVMKKKANNKNLRKIP
jgi:Fur family peroxide stress response transcriptional regulator